MEQNYANYQDTTDHQMSAGAGLGAAALGQGCGAKNPALKDTLDKAVGRMREIASVVSALEIRVNGPQPVSTDNASVQRLGQPSSYRDTANELYEGSDHILERLRALTDQI